MVDAFTSMGLSICRIRTPMIHFFQYAFISQDEVIDNEHFMVKKVVLNEILKHTKILGKNTLQNVCFLIDRQIII